MPLGICIPPDKRLQPQRRPVPANGTAAIRFSEDHSDAWILAGKINMVVSGIAMENKSLRVPSSFWQVITVIITLVVMAVIVWFTSGK
ncbi:MAG: hypothetical protein ACLP5H_27905 [Desulfomonilaceae bacterium]